MLTITIIGLIINIPLTFINHIGLLILILAGTSTALYPNVKWGPITNFDKIVAGVVIALTILSIIVSIIRAATTKKIDENGVKKDNIDSMML